MEKNNFYPIRFPLNILRNGFPSSQTEIMYFTNETTLPLYQIKFFQIKHIITANFNLFNESTASSLIKLYSIFQNPQKILKSFDLYPIFSQIPRNSLNELKCLVENKTFLYNHYFIMGEISRINSDYPHSLFLFEKGVENKEFFCFLHLSRIYIEQGFIEEYSHERSAKKTLDLLLDSFIYFGIYDKPFISMKNLHLLYLYYDSFEDFRQVVDWEKYVENFKGKLLKLLMGLNMLSEETYELFFEIKDLIYENSPILFGDLMQTHFFGFYNEDDNALNIYEEILRREPNNIYVNLRLFYEYKKRNDFNKFPIRKIFKRTILSLKELMFSPEFLQFSLLEEPEFIEYNISDFTIHQADRLLQFGDFEILLPLFRIYKYKEKSLKIGDNILQKQNLQQKLYKIAQKLIEIDNNEFKEGPLAYCLEKAKGCNRDSLKSFELYYELLLKTVNNRLDPFFFTYRLSSLLRLEKEFQNESEALLDLAFREVSTTLKKNIHNIISLYDISKIYRRKNETILQYSCYQLIVKIFVEFPENLLTLGEKLIYNSCLSKVSENFEMKTKNKNVLIETIQKDLPKDIMEKYIEGKTYHETLKKIKRRWDTFNNKKLNYKPHKLSGFVNLAMKESLNEAQSNNNRNESILKIPILQANLLDFDDILQKYLKNHLHIFPFDNFKSYFKEFKNSNSAKELIFSNKQKFFTVFKKVVLEGGLEKFIFFLKKIKLSAQCNQHNNFLKLVAVSMKFSNKPSSSFIFKAIYFYEPIKESLKEYFQRKKNVFPIKLCKTLTKILISLKQSNYYLKFLSVDNFVRNFQGIICFYDPEFNILTEENEVLSEKELNENKEITFCPELLFALIKKQRPKMNLASTLWSCGVFLLSTFFKEEFNYFNVIREKTINYEEFKLIFRQEAIDLEIKRLWNIRNLDFPSRIIKNLLIINPKERNFNELINAFQTKFSISSGEIFWEFLKNDEEIQEFYLMNGLIYKGEITDSRPNGYGILQTPKICYYGNFYNGNLHGKCILKCNKDDSFQKETLFFMNSSEIIKEFLKENKGKLANFIEKFVDNEVTLLFKEELLQSFYDISQVFRLKQTLETLGLSQIQLISEDNGLILIRVIENPLSFYEIISKQDLFPSNIKENFVFYWELCSFGFFTLGENLTNIKQSLLYGIKQVLQGIKIYMFEKKIETGYFKGYKGKLLKGSIFYYDDEFQLKKKIHKENSDFFELNDYLSKKKFFGVLENKLLHKTGFGKEYISENLLYEGEFINDKANGRGVFKHATNNQIFFEGIVQNYKPLYGRFYNPKNDIKYIEGLVLHTFDDDAYVSGFLYKSSFNVKYLGKFQLRKIWIDKEIYCLKNNDMLYSGYLQQGIINGKGKYTDLIGKFAIEGIFKENFFSGKLTKEKPEGFLSTYKHIIGVFELNHKEPFSNILELRLCPEKFYIINDFKDYVYYGFVNEQGLFNGFGIYHKKGSIYEGEFHNGLKQGFGTFIKSSLEPPYKYHGFWMHGAPTGYGKAYRGENLIYEGIFKKNNSFIGRSNDFDEKSGIKSIEGNFMIQPFTKNAIPFKFGRILLKSHEMIEINLEKINDFLNNIVCIVGVIKYNNSLFYEGEIVGFKANGLGFLYNKDLVFCGEFFENKKKGYGTMVESETFGSFNEKNNDFEKGICLRDNKIHLFVKENNGDIIKEMIKNHSKMLKVKIHNKMKIFLIEK